MRKKLEEIIAKYRELFYDTDSRLKAIQREEIYSDEYKKVLDQKVIAEFSANQAELREQVMLLIKGERDVIADKQKVTDHGPEYDLKLNNTLKVLELALSDMSDKEISSLIDPFKDDYTTMQILRRILQKEGKDELIPLDYTLSMIPALNELENQVNKVFSRPYSQNDSTLMTLTIAMRYYAPILPV